MYLKIKLIPNFKEEKIEIVEKDKWRVWLKEPAENNLANSRLLEILRTNFPNKPIRIVSGHHSPSKIVSIS